MDQAQGRPPTASARFTGAVRVQSCHGLICQCPGAFNKQVGAPALWGFLAEEPAAPPLAALTAASISSAAPASTSHCSGVR